MSTVELKRSVLSVALVATWFFALFAVGAKLLPGTDYHVYTVE